MNKRDKLASQTIKALHRSGVPIEQLAKDAAQMGVKSRFVYRTLGYRYVCTNRRAGTYEWIHSSDLERVK